MSYGAWLPQPPWVNGLAAVRYEHEDAEEIAALMTIAGVGAYLPGNADSSFFGLGVVLWHRNSGAKIIGHGELPGTVEGWRAYIASMLEEGQT